ncbi:tetratricopeptide repeat protein [Oceanibaculum pacificum]|uniref:Sel1 repeat family protein n=1 Tax=Oceanibaculum pacificum TaxID=580166 RepID=A0A154W709_9PROT|nr:tetratricopeptide repeat protein [Oceanibaculum pacificum]KZD09312.1 hypothetical protein AUP43_07535 [Oceanibaculum pacificum]
MTVIRAYQDLALDPPGWCRLAIEGVSLDEGPVEISIRRGGANRPWLGADWQEDEAWNRLEIVERTENGFTARIGPDKTVPLGGIATVALQFRAAGQPFQPGNGTRIAWPKIILPGGNSAGAVPPPPEPEPEPEPEPRILAADPPPPIEVNPDKPNLRKWLWLGPLLVLLAVGYYVWDSGMLERERPAVATGPFYDELAMREFLNAEPDGPAATAKADEFLAAGHPDLALLIYRHADRKQDAAAAYAIGRMYDPATHTKETSAFPAPDAEQAASYYRKAAEAGRADAQFALGRLLLSGATSDASGPEQGTVWLRRAADQGHAEAKESLAKLGIE